LADREVIVDSSAIIALAKGEFGADAIVPNYLGRGLISAINLAEFVQVLRRFDMDPESYLRSFEQTGMRTIPDDAVRARVAGNLERETSRWGLSLGDRFCIALAMEKRLPVLTTDRIWQDAGLGIEIILARSPATPG
jgi:PIN domain nuclease of toxin-antitoxin system